MVLTGKQYFLQTTPTFFSCKFYVSDCSTCLINSMSLTIRLYSIVQKFCSFLKFFHSVNSYPQGRNIYLQGKLRTWAGVWTIIFLCMFWDIVMSYLTVWSCRYYDIISHSVFLQILWYHISQCVLADIMSSRITIQI